MSPDLLRLFVHPIHESGLRYLISGSVAAMVYSEPRYTIDVDLAVFLNRGNIGQLEKCFAPAEFYIPPREVMEQEVARDCAGHFNIIHGESGLKADIYPSSKDRNFGWAWRNKRLESIEDCEFHVSPPEYIILWKLEYFRYGGSDKHLKDIRSILDHQGSLEEKSWLMEQIHEKRLHEEWNMVNESRDGEL